MKRSTKLRNDKRSTIPAAECSVSAAKRIHLRFTTFGSLALIVAILFAPSVSFAQDPPEEQKEEKAADPPAKEHVRRVPPSRRRAIPGAKPTNQRGTRAGQPGDENPPTAPPRRITQPPVQPPAEKAEDAKPDGTDDENDAVRVEKESTESDVPPEDRQYSFSCVDCTYEQLVEGFARQTGLGVIGEIPKEGKVKFVPTEKLSFKDALARIRMLLFNYKPHEPYWIVRKDTHLEVSRVNDMLRVLPLNRWYRSLDELWAAHLDDDELALVIHTPESGSIAAERQARDFLPDYVRWTPVEGQNSVTIFALVKDIRKYVDIIELIKGGTKDPRVIERIELSFISPSEAIDQLQILMSDDGGGAVAPTAPRTRTSSRRGARNEPSPLDTVTAPGINFIPFDDQQVLLVQAMPGKIKEIKSLLPYIDIEASESDSDIAVIPVQHTDASTLADTVRAILSAMNTPGDGAAAPGAAPRPARRNRAQKPSSVLKAGGITIITHPSENSLIVIADQESITQVRGLVERFDVAGVMGPIRIPVKNVSAGDVIPQIIEVLGTGTAGKPPATKFQLIANPTDDELWFTGTERDLDKVREVAGMLDVSGVAPTLHIAKLKKQSPTFVAGILQELEPSAEATPKPNRSPARRGKQVAVTKFTPNDEQSRLYIFCTDSEWETYQAVIAQLENEISDRPPFIKIPLAHIDPEDAIDQLVLLQSAETKASGARLAATDDAVLVIGATDQAIKEFQAIAAEIDRAGDEVLQRTFEIQHGDPAAIKSAIETLVGGVGGKQKARSRRRPTGKQGAAAAGTVLPDVTIFQLQNRLVVQATPDTMRDVEKIIAEFDVDEGASVMKVYNDFQAGCDIDALAETLVGMLQDPAKPRPKTQGAVKNVSADGGPILVPQTAAGQLVVLAKPNEFPKIEEYLSVLRVTVESPVPVTEIIDLTYVKPETMIDMIEPLLSLKADMLVDQGVLQDDSEPTTGRKKRPRRGGKPGEGSDQFHLQADVQKDRLIIAAPQVLVDSAKELIAKFDIPSDDEAVFRTVALHNGPAADMVRAIKEMMGGVSRRTSRRATDKPVAAPETFDTDTLQVVEAPGGSAVVLHGPARDVEEATQYIEQLDSMSEGGRDIKIFNIKVADVFDLGELIVNVLATPAPTQRPGLKPRRGRASAQGLEDDTEFETSKTWTGPDLYMKGDKILSTLLVATTPPKMKKIEEIVERFDGGSETIERPSIPKFFYELENREAADASLDLELLLSSVWDGPDVPTVDYLPFGETLVVRYPDEGKFDDIRRLIREYIDKPGEGPKVRKKGIMALTGTSATETALMLKMAHPEIQFNIIDHTPTKELDAGMERLRAHPATENNRCVLPLAVRRMVSQIALSSLGQNDDPPQTPPDPEENSAEEDDGQEEPPPEEEPIDPVQQATKQLLSQKVPLGKAKSSKSKDKEQTLNVYVDDSTGELIIEGGEDVLEDLPSMIDELKEQTKDLTPRPDIRIYRVRYIDVYLAAEILGEMFNASRQQVQQAAAAQRAQMQRLRQQQQAARRAQQQQQQQAGRGGPPNQQRGQEAQQQADPLAQLPPESVRIYPNPRDRSLILRAEASQYPAILELLATIDQPQPMNSELKVFPLKKLNASEVEELLDNMLGLSASATRRTGRGSIGDGPPAGRGGRRTSSPRSQSEGSYLPKTLMNEMVAGTGTGALGVDAKDIKLSSNDATNTVIVMAPPVAIDYIGDIIKQLENQNLPERETRYYDLKWASPDAIVELLQTKFGKPSQSGGKGSASGPGEDLTTPTFAAYPRLNLVTAIATPDQLQEIEAMITRLDVPGAENDWQYVPLQHADAKSVSETLSQMFGGAALSGGKSGGSRGKDGAATGPQFIGDEGGRMLVFSAAKHLHPAIKDAIAKLESDAAEAMQLHVITLVHAKPSDVADAIDKAYGSTGSKRGASRQSTTQYTLTPHDATKRLFVRADDAFFAEVESLAKSLDQPRTPSFEFRVYPLQYADAVKVHEQMTRLMTDYMKLLSPEERGAMDAFSVDVNEQANALVVLGNSLVFNFLEENLAKIDNPATLAQKPSVMMTALKTGDAKEMAANITQLWAQKDTKSREEAPIVQANPSLNMLIVRGTPEQLKEIKEEFIDPLENESPLTLKTETIGLTYADANAVADSINQLFEDKKRAVESAGTGRGKAPMTFTVVVTPVPSTKQVIVQASDENMQFVKARIAELDTEEIASKIRLTPVIYAIHYADPNNVAKIINEWGKSRTQGQGKGQSTGAQDVVNAVADPGTRTVVVTATQTNQIIVKELIDGLDDEKVASVGEAVQVVPILYGNASEMQTAITEYLRKPAGAGGKGDLAGDMRVSVLAESNALVVSGKKEDVDRIESTIRQLDQSGEESGTPQIIHLSHAQAAELAPNLQEMFGNKTKSRGNPPVILANEAGNSLIVRADRQDLGAIRSLVADLDKEEEAKPNFRLVSVAQGVNITDLADKVEQTINESASSGSGAQTRTKPLTVKATPDTRTHSIILAGSPSLFDEAEELIKAMEKMSPPGGQTMSVITLGNTPVEEIQSLIDSLKGDGGSGASRSGSSRRSSSPSRRRPNRPGPGS